ELHQGLQIRVRADLVAEDGQLPVDHVEVLDADVPAVADDRVDTALGEHAHRVRRYVPLADQVQYHPDADPVGQLPDRECGLGSGQFEDDIGAQVPGGGRAYRVDLDHDQPGRGEQPQQ